MKTRYECALNGEPLSDIAPEVLITDISENAARMNVQTQQRPHRDGMRVVSMLRQSLSVTVTFVIWERDTTRRKAICQRVQAWARRGGDLTVNDREGQRLRVVCEALPSLTSSMSWSRAEKLTFTAYDFPFWEDEYPSVKAVTGDGTLFVPGTAGEAFASVKATNTSGGAVAGVTVAAGDTFMTFDAISVPAKGTLEIGYDENRALYARIGNTSVLANRTANSSDDLIVTCGEWNAVTVSGGLSALFSARGVYL